MSESKHTPGPWRICRHSHINKEQWLSILNGAWDITHNGASNPAIVACSKYSAMSPEENLANARLIAAAPDLLAACKYTKELLSHGVGQSTHALALIEAAMAEAEKGA